MMLLLLRRLWPFGSRRTEELPPGPAEQQVGAIPFALADGEAAFLVVTSRRSGRWIFPKGSLIRGLSATESAAREAVEEAGVEGRIIPEPVGIYRSWKLREGERRPIAVTFYLLHVQHQLDDWPERKERKRHWTTLDEAPRLLLDPALLALTGRAAARVRGLPLYDELRS